MKIGLQSRDDVDDLGKLCKHGPITSRSCKDILCFIIFVLFAVLMIIISGYGFYKGDP